MRGRGGARRAAAFVLALSWALAFAGCEGDGGGSPAGPTPAAPNPAAATEAPPPQTPSPQTPDAPVTLTVAQGGSSGGTTGTEPNQVVGPAEPVTLVDGGSARHVPLDRLFSGGDPGTVAVTSEDETVVTAQFVSDVAPPYVNIAPAGPGETTVVVTATTAAGSATQRIPATVQAAEAPRVIGEIPPAVLVAGARGIHWSLDAVFEPAGLRVEVESPDDAVVLAEGVDGYGGSLTLAPVGPGEVSVTVTASNAAGHADATMAVRVLDKLRIGLRSRAGAAGGGIRLVEGARLRLEIRPQERVLAAHAAGVVTFRVVSEGPEGQVELPETVSAGRLGDFDERTAFAVAALRDETAGEEDAAYSISLAPEAEGLPSWMEIVPDEISLVVVDSPAADCSRLAVDGAIRQVTGGSVRGTVTIQAPHPDTSLNFISPYVERPRQAATWRTAAAYVFPEALPYQEMPEGFEQTVRLRWWDQDLRLTVEAPGCEPIEMVCGESGCEVEE